MAHLYDCKVLFFSTARSCQHVMKKKIKNLIISGITIVIVIVIGINSVLSLKPTTDTQTSIDEKMLMHIHPRLYLYFNGQPYMVPQNVGIEPDLWKDHLLDKYGMEGMAPLHTHTADGMIHVESKMIQNYTLGEFLSIWGIDLKDSTVSVTSYGQPVSDYRNHVLKDDEPIMMNITSSR